MARYNNISKKDFEKFKTCLFCKGEVCSCEHCENMDYFILSDAGRLTLDKIDAFIGEMKNEIMEGINHKN